MSHFIHCYLTLAAGVYLGLSSVTWSHDLIIGGRRLGYPWGQVATALAWPALLFIRFRTQAVDQHGPAEDRTPI